MKSERTYRVKLQARVWMEAEIEVEASSPVEAGHIAISDAIGRKFPDNEWGFMGGQPSADEVEASDVEVVE